MGLILRHTHTQNIVYFGLKAYDTYLVRLLFRDWNVCHGHLMDCSLSLLKKYDKKEI